MLAPHILGDLDNEPRRCKELQAHLLCCPDCTQMYDGFKETIGFVLEHKAEFAQAFEKARAREKNAGVLMSSLTNFLKSRKIFIKASAAAACLVIGVLTWLIFSNYSKPHTLPQTSSSGQVASATKPSMKIEWVTNTGNVPIPSGKQITSAGQLRTLLINGKHQMIMNANTVLAIEPLIENSNIGCLVKLASGQIYTHVEHDGNPFIVDTANGKTVITGTTFDVKATDDRTTLVVSEGTVKFESEKGTVKVAAGQTSEIVGQSIPSIPLSCDTSKLTAWATGYKAGAALAKTELNPDPWDLPLSFGEKPIVLAETDYKSWVAEKREWFKKDFPWIFELKDALAKESIEVDYPELLIKSGDVWQFVCLQRFPAKFSVPDFDSLLKTAISYGFDKEWLLKNVPTAKYALENQVFSKNGPARLAAFERWLEYLDETNESEPPTLIYSFHASKYLTNTRSLIWFAAKGGKYDLTKEERTKVLTLLQEEVTAACECQSDVLYPSDDQKSYSCENKCQDSVDNIIGHIEAMKAVEEKIVEYGISE